MPHRERRPPGGWARKPPEELPYTLSNKIFIRAERPGATVGTLRAIGRVLSSAVFDATTNRMIVYGGDAYNSCTVHPNDVWWLNAATATGPELSWTKVRPEGSPPPARVAQTGVYDPASGRMIVFWGGDYAAPHLVPTTPGSWITPTARVGRRIGFHSAPPARSHHQGPISRRIDAFHE